MWEWGGLTQPPDNAWTIATLFDAYYGFITFYVWLAYKERRWLPRIGWLIAILLLGNMAMSAYVLLQLRKLPAEEPLAILLATAQTHERLRRTRASSSAGSWIRSSSCCARA